jgi:hypothetical protein
MYRWCLLREYPHLNNSELSITGNIALAHFLRLKLTTPTLRVIESAQKANKGSKPLEELEPIGPGTFVMVDILNINNPFERSITKKTSSLTIWA